ncbi:hypothetical protein [Synoicihabitans lomoniglobus]|uniref:Glycosyl transferase n=1 Tax=Synoicihabitans lomoniglobus TaxID=2909285 RepID=A0AAF0I3Z6_9BACT|nr:hypothetical protein [Opitutaceae bacterium LMO-M01]WED67332.1 hypothetical protein PXH66_10775 [Opitutaceae bacterium LMO-M01]
MQEAIAKLPTVSSAAGTPLEVHLLTGRNFAYQSAFCLYTLARHCPCPIAVNLYDDGTLHSESIDSLQRIFPDLVLHAHQTLVERRNEFLPREQFPVLCERWENYPHIRKIIDVHLARVGPRLVLDSDLLFWREPRFLLDWARSSGPPLHAIDAQENYGYPRGLMEELTGAPIGDRVNVGVCAIRSEQIDWEFLEYASRRMTELHGTNYYLEQALFAMLVAREGPAAIAPATDYITMPSSREIAHPTAAMHHYVDLSRIAYHRQAWRLALQST